MPPPVSYDTVDDDDDDVDVRHKKGMQQVVASIVWEFFHVI